MKRSTLICLFTVPLLWACTKDEDAGPTISETRSTTDFSQIELNGSHELRINPDVDFEIRVTAPDNLMPYIETYVTGGRLIVRERSNNIDHDRVLIEVSENYLDYIELNGSGAVIAEDTLYSDALNIDLDGSGDINILAKAELIRLSIDGSGKIEAWGEANEVRSNISGSGLISSRNVESSMAEASIGGSGSVDIYAAESLYARIDGSGVIRYWGNPETLDTGVDGSGTIIEIN